MRIKLHVSRIGKLWQKFSFLGVSVSLLLLERFLPTGIFQWKLLC